MLSCVRPVRSFPAWPTGPTGVTGSSLSCCTITARSSCPVPECSKGTPWARFTSVLLWLPLALAPACSDGHASDGIGRFPVRFVSPADVVRDRSRHALHAHDPLG